MGEKRYECWICGYSYPKYELHEEQVRILKGQSGGGWKLGKSSWSSSSMSGSSRSRKGSGGNLSYSTGRNYYGFENRYTCQDCYEKQPHGLWETLFGKPRKREVSKHETRKSNSDRRSAINIDTKNIIKQLFEKNQSTIRNPHTTAPNVVSESATERFVRNMQKYKGAEEQDASNLDYIPSARFIKLTETPEIVVPKEIIPSSAPLQSNDITPAKNAIVSIAKEIGFIGRLPSWVFLPACLIIGVLGAFNALILTAVVAAICGQTGKTMASYALIALIVGFALPITFLGWLRAKQKR